MNEDPIIPSWAELMSALLVSSDQTTLFLLLRNHFFISGSTVSSLLCRLPLVAGVPAILHAVCRLLTEVGSLAAVRGL